MLDYINYTQITAQKPGYNEGFRVYMLSVFQNMGIALIIIAVVAILITSSLALMQIFFETPLQCVVILASFGMYSS